MTAALIILASLVVVGTLLYLHHRFTSSDADTAPAAEADTVAEADDACCGMHITCERDSLLAAVSDKVVYYDDEELDAYAGRRDDEYSRGEIEQFRDVLLTLLPSDIAGWGRSLQLRGITLPADVRDELLMIVAEERAKASRPA